MTDKQYSCILYEGIHLDEPAKLKCSHCESVFVGRWWWTPEDNSLIICEDCSKHFDTCEEWPTDEEPPHQERVQERNER